MTKNHMDNFEENFQEEYTNKDKFEFVLACIPFVNFSLIFSKTPKHKKTKQYIEQSLALFIVVIIGTFILNIIHLGGILSFAYIVTLIYLSLKAYDGVYIKIDFLEKLVEYYNNTKIK